MHKNDQQSSDILRRLILEEDQKRMAALENELQALRDRLNDKEALIENLDPIVADTLALKDALPFQIHEIFLIHSETGILLRHLSPAGAGQGANQELISGMLTAINDFARTVFSESESRGVNEIEYEDRKIHLEIGRYGYLAVVTSGIEPEDFLPAVKRCERQIHNRFFKEMRTFDGQTEPFSATDPILRKLYNRYAGKLPGVGSEEAASQSRGLLALLAVVLVAVVSYLTFDYFSRPAAENSNDKKQVAAQTSPVSVQEVRRIADESLRDLAGIDPAMLRFVISENMLQVTGTVATKNVKLNTVPA